MQLYIAYKNYSSWSLRPWLAMAVAGIEFEEVQFTFYHDDRLKQFAQDNQVPACVPMLHTRIEGKQQLIWDSMAIMEFLAEQFPGARLWPADQGLRALARAASAEMHSGFMALRSECPMNCRATTEMTPSSEVEHDLRRLAAIWQRFAEQSWLEGPFLCGHFGIVDAMYAPVMWRVRNYGLTVSSEFDDWSKAMFELPEMQQWLQAAQEEPWQIAQYDAALSA